MASEIPKDISAPDQIDPTSAIQSGEIRKQPEEGAFSSYMKETPPTEATPQTRGPSPIELSQQGKIAAGEPPTLKTVETQMRSVSGSLGDVKNQLHTKGLKLKQSQKYMLRNKLSEANDQIRSAANQVGVNVSPAVDLKGRKNPIAKFLELVSDGQEQLSAAAQQVNNLNASGKSLNAGDLLLVQVRLQKAQQELDYSSVILGKAVDLVKTLFNVQI